MTYRCNLCDGEVELIDTNGAEYPEPLIEHYECVHCGHKQTNVLTA